jgi:ornithine carbamoyltransferase
MRHFIDLLDFTTDEIRLLLEEAARLKADFEHGQRPPLLQGRVLGMVFEKPSLRTRVSFQAAMAQLGGASVFMTGPEAGLGSREPIPDFARVMSQYVDCVVLRTFHHATVVDFAAHSTCPVINGLSDLHHPCQALADLLTLQEVFGKFDGRTIVFVGDGNNVARSLAVICAKLGARFILAAPEGYGFDNEFLTAFRQKLPHADMTQNGKPQHSIPQADAVYTDVWTSMGQEAEQEQRKKIFAPYQVNDSLMTLAPAHARFMHCLPAHRGEEVTDSVLDGERSVVVHQAANRMHAQKALMVWLMNQK